MCDTLRAQEGVVEMKVRNHICAKCGMEVELPDFDETRPLYEYRRKMDRAILKHAWQCHRKDFPPQFTSLSQFMRWRRTPEGREWDEKQGLIAEAERIVREEK
jgi:hypothetical protein